MFNSKEVDWKAYHEGQASCHKTKGELTIKNPHKRESKEWQSWNLGWNSMGEER